MSCYSSKNLTDWTFRNQVLQLADPENFGPSWVLERPKVFYNAKTKKYVMYMHIDGPHPGNPRYDMARVGCSHGGPGRRRLPLPESFRPLGHESRDIGQFIDDDGTPYLIFEDRPFGFRIAPLSADYLNVEKEVCLIALHMEGGAVVRYQGLYYVIGSALTGWAANPNRYATARSLAGPWSEFRDIAPPETKTYGAQSTLLLQSPAVKPPPSSSWPTSGSRKISPIRATCGCRSKSAAASCGCPSRGPGPSTSAPAWPASSRNAPPTLV